MLQVTNAVRMLFLWQRVDDDRLSGPQLYARYREWLTGNSLRFVHTKATNKPRMQSARVTVTRGQWTGIGRMPNELRPVSWPVQWIEWIALNGSPVNGRIGRTGCLRISLGRFIKTQSKVRQNDLITAMDGRTSVSCLRHTRHITGHYCAAVSRLVSTVTLLWLILLQWLPPLPPRCRPAYQNVSF